jgi:hypothetical protein
MSLCTLVSISKEKVIWVFSEKSGTGRHVAGAGKGKGKAHSWQIRGHCAQLRQPLSRPQVNNSNSTCFVSYIIVMVAISFQKVSIYLPQYDCAGKHKSRIELSWTYTGHRGKDKRTRT